MFPAATMGRVLVRAEDRIGLFELSSHRLIAELTSVNVKYVVWSADGSHVALLGKHSMSPPLPRRCSFCLRQLTRTIAHTPPLRPRCRCGTGRPRPDANLQRE